VDMSYVPAIGFLVLWGVTALAVLAFAWILWRIAKRLSASQLTGSDETDTLLGLAAACAVCWPVFPWAGRTISAIGFYLTRGIPAELASALEMTHQVCTSKLGGAECTKAAVLRFSDNWGQVTSNLITRLANELPYGWLVGFTIIWIVAGQLLGAIRESEASQRPPLFRWVSATSRVDRLNTILILTLGVSLYLSIASIAAIPALTDKTPISEAAKIARLSAQLDVAVDPLATIDPNPFARLEQVIQTEKAALQAAAQPAATPSAEPAPVPVQPVTVGRSRQARAGARPTPEQVEAAARAAEEQKKAADKAAAEQKEAAVKAAAERTAVLESIQQAINRMKRVREDVSGRLGAMHAAVKRNIDSRKREAETAYELNVDRIGSRERSQHFTQLVLWFRGTKDEAITALTTCETGLKSGDASARSWASDVEGLLSLRTAAWTSNAVSGEGAQRTYDHYYESGTLCRSDLTFNAAPERPRLGLGLGPFRLVAQWLLETESVSLALIVGMIGFGLLGSAVSTFVRETQEQKRTPGGPLVDDLAGVILRGVSAAIVVFLGVKGGLTVFAGNEGEPNPYVLLFTCLVGAVFSERVWAWAREKILAGGENKPAAEKKPAPDAAPAGEEKPATPALPSATPATG